MLVSVLLRSFCKSNQWIKNLLINQSISVSPWSASWLHSSRMTLTVLEGFKVLGLAFNNDLVPEIPFHHLRRVFESLIKTCEMLNILYCLVHFKRDKICIQRDKISSPDHLMMIFGRVSSRQLPMAVGWGISFPSLTSSHTNIPSVNPCSMDPHHQYFGTCSFFVHWPLTTVGEARVRTVASWSSKSNSWKSHANLKHMPGSNLTLLRNTIGALGAAKCYEERTDG